MVTYQLHSMVIAGPIIRDRIRMLLKEHHLSSRYHSPIIETIDEFLSSQESATRTYKITGSPDVLDRFERWLSHVQWCSSVGHSTSVSMDIDGDGADRFKVLEPDVKSAMKDHDIGSRSTSHEQVN